MTIFVQTPSVSKMATSDDNAAHRIGIQYCFEGGLTLFDGNNRTTQNCVLNIGIHLAQKVKGLLMGLANGEVAR